MVERTLTFEDNRLASALFGKFDEHLALIEQKLGVEASARGTVGLAAGEADAVSEAVGQAALLYFDVSSRRMTDLSFDWDAVLQFEGNTGPYLQYAHARMSGIFRKAGELGLAAIDEPGDLAALGTDDEWLLVQKLRGYAGALRRAAELREPFEVAHYLYELASVFNTFYNRHVVLDVAEPVRSRARLTLVRATRSVLRSGLQLLGIRALDQM